MPEDQNADTAAQPVDAPKTEKTYTESELNAMMADRLAKHEKALKKTWEQQLAEEKRKAEQTAEERAKELELKLSEREAEIERARREASDRVALAGKVHDLDYAIYKLGDGEPYRKDGALDVAAFLEANPTLQAQPTPKPGPAPTTAGGGTDYGKAGMNQLIRQKAGRT